MIVMKAISRALKETKVAYLHMANKMVSTNTELALMGSCVLVILIRDEDIYLINVSDNHSVMARRVYDVYNLVGQGI